MKLKQNSRRTLLGGIALAALFSVAASASELTDKARAVLASSQTSLITVSALNKLDMSGMGLPVGVGGLGEAQETSCGGLVIDGSGLTVVSYTALNPMEKVAGAIKIKLNEEDEGLKSKSELSRIQMHLADGTEVPGRIVLKDKELDLAFVMPDPKEGEKAPSFTPAKLSGAATAKELDDVVLVSRHAKEFGYQPSVTLGHVTSVIKKPRPLYDLSAAGQPGSPVYLPDGQLLGVSVAMGEAGTGLMSMGAMQVLVLPTSEITKLADQARKAAEKKPAGEKK